MNLEDIDNIFNNNQHQFDKMPSDQLWERLEDKLDATPSIWEEKPQTKVKWLGYVAAAAVILMMTIPAIYLIEGPTTNSKEVAANYSADEPSTTSSIEEKSAGRINKLEDTGSMVETFDKDLAAKTDNPIEATTEDKSELIAKADTEKKPTFTAKKETTSKQFALQNNKNQNIEKPKKITSPKPKPTVSDRSLKMAKKPAIPSMSDDTEAGDFDAEYAIEEEMEIALDEVNVTAYKNTPPPAPKAASVRASAKFDIANTEDVYAYTRYNTEFQPSHLSNFMPYDGDERLSQSTLKKMPKAIEEVTVGSSKKMKKRGKSKDNIALKRSASKEQLFMQEGVPHIDFLRALEGNWTQYLDSLTYTEKWTMNANNGSLQGVANTSSNGIVAFEENFSISDRNGKLVYIMDFPPKLTYPTVFTQKDENSTSNKKELVFENDRLEFPSKITYRLSTDTMLKITFEGQKEGKSISKSLIMYKE